MDGFDRLPDSLILLIFNSVSDVKTLIRCRSVSKRFYSLVPETESLLLRVDRVISPESDTEYLLFSFLKSLLKSIQDLFKSDHKPTATLTLTHNSPAQILSQFHRIRDLQIQLPAGDLKLDKGVVIKWRAEFGNTLKSCVILGFRTAAEDGNADVDFDFAGGLKARVVWTISALIAASARHYLLKEVVKEHEEMEGLELKDEETEGIVVMDKEGPVLPTSLLSLHSNHHPSYHYGRYIYIYIYIYTCIFFPANLSHIKKQKENTEKPQKSQTHNENFSIKQLFGSWFSFPAALFKGFFFFCCFSFLGLFVFLRGIWRMAQVQVQPQSPVSVPNGVASNGMNQFMSTSLYVGDLDHNVTETQLYDLFNQLGQVVSIRVCRDLTSRRSLGYGYVNYSNIHDAARALEVLNFTPVNGKPIRIMYSHRDPTIRKSGAGNIYIKNLDKAIDNKALHDTFSTFGNILSCKVVTDSLGQSLGYGFVQFDNEESAKSAIDKLNGMLLNDKQVYVGPFLRKQERESAIDKTKFNNVYVKNLSETTTDEDLKKIFGEYGTITSAVVMRDGDGKSKCFGFVNFENPDDAARSVVALNEKTFDDKEWYVGKAQKKSEREIELKGQLEQTLKEKVDKFEGLNLYVKNLDDSITDDKLKDLFSEFGTVTSCKVMRDPSGVSRGSGFVAFSTAEEASRALAEMNGKMVVSKPLYVALAQRKEERRARLQAQFSQMRSSAMAPAVGPRMPIYPPGTPGIGQQLFYGQSPPAILPPQPGFGYQQQLVPGMRPNFFVPMVQPGQPAQRPGSRRFGAGPVQPQQPLPLMQQQMLPRGRVYRYPPGRNLPDVGGMPFRDAAFSQPMQAGALATALANATPEQQRTLLGENLYPLVDQLEHDNAAKVTGMLLEMDQTEVLHLLESPEALKAKVAEAMEVLRSVQQQQQVNNPTDHMASLSLND